MILYTLDNQVIKHAYKATTKFTGIVEYALECKVWLLDGKRHRLDGPAVEHPNGSKWWFIHDVECSEEQHALLVDIMKLKGLT